MDFLNRLQMENSENVVIGALPAFDLTTESVEEPKAWPALVVHRRAASP